MTPREYLKNRLETCSQYELTDADKKFIEEKGLREFLYKQITRKKFRRWKLKEEAENIINRALDYCIPNEKRFVFRFPFGGYKLWRFESAPEVDWAEFFSFCHFLSYLAPIAAAYKPGFELLFSSDEVFVERLNNIPTSETESYKHSFEKLISVFEKHIPSNISISLFQHRDLFGTEEEFEEKFAFAVEKIGDTWKTDRTKKELERELKTSRMNIRWDGSEDWTILSEEEKQKKIEQGVMYHDALLVMPGKEEFNKAPDKIHLFTESFSKYVPIGSSKTSIVRFWVGTGVLEKREDTFLERILSITQYDSLKNESYTEHEIDMIPLKNFKSIRVYDKQLDFSR